MKTKSRQVLSIALIPFVLAASAASLDALVLCTAGGHGVSIEVTHSGHSHCHPHASHACHTEGDTREIKHEHRACNSVHLKLNLGHVKDQRVQLSLESQTFVVETPDRAYFQDEISLPGNRYSLHHLQSVVLLI